MLNTTQAARGMAVAPHSLASQAALSVLREGGNAIEAMLAAASTIAVVYPHMNGIGGDGFWVVSRPGEPVVAIDAAGPAAAAATVDFYRERGMTAIPSRGPLSANTLAGTIGGWEQAQELSRAWGGRLPLSRLLEDAIHYAEQGMPVTVSQAENTRKKLAELAPQAGFAETFLMDGQPPAAGARFVQKRLGGTLRELARQGLDAFYRGELSEAVAADLATVGSPVTAADLRQYRARRVTPLRLAHSHGELYNMTPPTQGLVSLIILGLLDRLGLDRHAPGSVEHVHLVVEATKQAFAVRDRHITDPAHMAVDPQACLDDEFLAGLAGNVRLDRAAPWGQGRGPADTIWMGVIDGNGCAVSFIQSIYHEFGSGLVLPTTGINWQNRGCSFSLDAAHINALAPGKRPFHTLNPALARLRDGRIMVYGTMGGDGQPQTQAAVFTRHVVFGQPLQQAVTAPRWLLGRTWGQASDSLKLEARFDAAVMDGLRALGHEVEVLGDFDETMGHAGAIVRYPDGLFEGAFDPRSNGAAAGY